MDASAIEKIKEDVTTKALQGALDKVKSSDPLVATPKEFEIKDLERYMPNRSRFRGKMSTISPEDFVRYCTDNDRAGAACFIDPEDMSAKTIFNLGDDICAGHADYVASLKLQKTAEFKALLGVDGQRMYQKDLAEWLEDWSDFIQPFDASGNAVDVKKAISAVRRLTIESHRKEDHEEQDFKASKSALESVEAKSDNGLPHGFRYVCVSYNGLADHSFECRISVLTGDDKPKFAVRIKRLEAKKEEVGKEFMQALTDCFEECELSVYLGEFSA